MTNPSKYEPKHDVIEELKTLIDDNNWNSQFDEALESANQLDELHLDRPIKTLEQYYSWLDRLVEWIPQIRSSDHPNHVDDVYHKFCKFYWILDQHPVRELQGDIHSKDREITPLSKWIVSFAKAWGLFLDTPESTKYIKTFEEDPDFHIDDYVVPESGWSSFNEFFARKVKPGRRPIAEPENDNIVVSPTDCTPVVWHRINNDSKIIAKNLEWSIEQLLQDSPYKSDFKGGMFMHSFLNVNDYHRLHVPVQGTIKEARVIPGRAYLSVYAKNGISVSRNVRRNSENFDLQDDTGYQFTQMRGLIVIDSPKGLVAILPIGMAQISSIVLDVKEGDYLNKGDEFGRFLFGGSDIVILFSKNQDVHITAEVENHYKQGTQIAKIK